ncbi:mucin-17-like isoform X2 [Narcine bancroftii]|uniref:mucin-17-like isoform X2 n=1 Tax=Narcine bancroftii TaxID=1343680 RepID=UPI00383129B0
MLLRLLLFIPLLLSAVSAPRIAEPRHAAGPAGLSRPSPVYHVEDEPMVLDQGDPASGDGVEENNWDTAKRKNALRNLQEFISKIKEKCTFKGPDREEIHTEVPYFEEFAPPESELIEEPSSGDMPAIECPAEEEIHTEFPYFEEFAPPESELIEEPSSGDMPVPEIEFIEEFSTGAESGLADSEIELEKLSTEAEPGPESEFFKEPSAHVVPVIGITSPEMEKLSTTSEDSRVASGAVNKEPTHPIPAIGFVSPEMELVELKPATSTIAPIPDLGFISPDMAKHEIEYHPDKTTTSTVPVFHRAKPENLIGGPISESSPEYEEILYLDPDDKKIQKVLQNFQQATQEDQLHHRAKKKGKRMSKRNEPSDDFGEDNWSQVQKDQRAKDLAPSRSLSDFEIEDQESTEENLSENDSDIVEEKLDELEANTVPDNNENRELKPVTNDFEGSDSNGEAFDELMEDLDTSDNNVQNERPKVLNKNLQGKFTDDEMVQKSVNKLQSDQEELTRSNIPSDKHVEAKQTIRDIVEDLIAAILIAVFVILALVAMFYTVSFVKAKEKEKCPTITIIESGPTDGTRKYTVGSSKKHSPSVCYGKIVRSPRQRQVRYKYQKKPVQQTFSSNVSTESNNVTTETMTLPPPQMTSTCPQPLRSHISRAHSPRPLSPYPVSPYSQSSRSPPNRHPYFPSSPQQHKHKETKKSGTRYAALPDYQAAQRTMPRRLPLQDIKTLTSPGDRTLPDYPSVQPTSPKRLSRQDAEEPTAPRDRTLSDYPSVQPTSPKRLSRQDAEEPTAPRDRTLPDYQDAHPITPRRLSPQDVKSFTSPRDRTLPDYPSVQSTSPRRLSQQNAEAPASPRDRTIPDYQAAQPSTPRLSRQDVPSSTEDTDLEFYQESPLALAARRLPDAGLPSSPGDISMPYYQDPHQSIPKRISFHDIGSFIPESDASMAGYQSSRMMSMDGVASAGDTTLPGYQPSYLPSSSKILSMDHAELPTPAEEMTLSDHQPSMPSSLRKMPFPATGSAMDAQLVSVSDRNLGNTGPKQSSSFLSPVHSPTKSQTSMQFPYQLDRNGDSQYPLSIMKSKTKSFALKPPYDQLTEPSDTFGVGSPDRSSRSAYVSDDGDIVSVESYADPSSVFIRPVVSSQHAQSGSSLSPSIPQPRRLTPSKKPPPLSLSFSGVSPRFLSPRPKTQRPRSKSINIPMVPLSPYPQDQYEYQGSVSAKDLSPRKHYIPKESDIKMIPPDTVQSPVYPLSPLPQGLNQQSQFQYQSPSLSPQHLSSLSSPHLREESIMASRPQISSADYSRSAYDPDGRSITNINQGQQLPLMLQTQQPSFPSPDAAASRSFIEMQTPSFSSGGIAPYVTHDLSNMGTSYTRMPYSSSYILPSSPLQGWEPTGGPGAGQVSISNIPSQGGIAQIPPNHLQSRHDSFHPSMALPSAAYSIPQQSALFPSYQQLSGSESDVQSRSQGTLQSPLPNVPPPLSPSTHPHSQFSFPSLQPLSPLSLTILRDPAVPPGSQSSGPQELFQTTRFEDSEFLKESPISQSFIYKDYSSPKLSPVAPAQSFNLTPRRYSYRDYNVFTYPYGSQHFASTPKESRSIPIDIDPEIYHTALNSASSISSVSSEETPYSKQLGPKSIEDNFPTSSESVYDVPPTSPSFREKSTGLSSDYSINEIGSDSNLIPNAHYYTAKSFFNDSSDYTNSE